MTGMKPPSADRLRFFFAAAFLGVDSDSVEPTGHEKSHYYTLQMSIFLPDFDFDFFIFTEPLAK